MLVVGRTFHIGAVATRQKTADNKTLAANTLHVPARNNLELGCLSDADMQKKERALYYRVKKAKKSLLCYKRTSKRLHATATAHPALLLPVGESPSPEVVVQAWSQETNSHMDRGRKT